MPARALDPVGIGLLVAYGVTSAIALVVLRHFLPVAKQALANSAWLSSPVLFAGFGAMLYIASFGLWLGVLARTPVTIAYPIAIGLSMVLTTIGAVLILGESFRPVQALAMAMVLAGVALLARG